jgi:DNA-binding XRE family transcriptional regulator
MADLDPKAARVKLGLTQTQMGQLLGYSGEHVRQMVYEIETGDKPLMPCQRRLLQAYLDGYRPKDWPKQNAL